MTKGAWYEKHGRPCKIGTMPMVVQIHGQDAPGLREGQWCRVRYDPGGRWERVLFTRVDDDGYFMADR